MRINDRVIYVDSRGETHAASVTAVVDTGASGAKVLDLKVGGHAKNNVAHERDHVKPEAYWRLPSKGEPLPDDRAPTDEQPPELAQAEADIALPESANPPATPTKRAKRVREH